MSFLPRSFRPPFAATRARALAGAIVSSLAAMSACLDDAPTSAAGGPVSLRINAQVGGGGGPVPDWTVGIRVYYWTQGEQQVDLPTDPSEVRVARNATVDQPVRVDITLCLQDPDRADFESEGETTGCRLYVELSLLDDDGNPLSTDTENAVASVPGETVTVPDFVLPPGEIVPSSFLIEFTAPDQSPVPEPTQVAVTSSTTEPLGTLSAEITYLSGTNWLSRTIDQGEGSAVLIGPTTTNLAPGMYEATVLIESNRDFVPAEILVRYTVTNRPKRATITGAGNGSGTIVVNEADASCTIVAGQTSGTCAPLRPHGSQLTLSPGANPGSSFVGWSGACTGTGNCVLTMDQDRAVSATFTLAPKRLTVLMAGSGNGSVSSFPNELITCVKTGTQITGQCTVLVPHGSQVTLSTFSPTGSTFAAWSGACSGQSCSLTMDQDRTVTATFNLVPRNLTVSGAGNGTGTVTSSPVGINCTLTAAVATGQCVVAFSHGTVVTLSATTAPGMVLDGWGGACLSSTTNQCTVTMNNSVNVTAIFIRATFPLTVVGSGTGSGTVVSKPDGIACEIVGGRAGAGCALDFPVNTQVTLTATPAEGHSFDGWTGQAGCSETRTCIVTLNQARTVTATFLGPPPPGRDIVVLNDLNVFDNSRMEDPNNVLFVRNLVSFASSGPRNGGTVAQFDCGRLGVSLGSFDNLCTDAASSLFRGAIAEAGMTFARTAIPAGQMTGFATNVRVLFLFMPCQEFTVPEVNALKQFAAEGGRVVFIGEHAMNEGFYFPCLPTENQLLSDMGALMRNLGSAFNCAATFVVRSLGQHQITQGMTQLSIACASEILLGPNDFALYHDTSNAHVLAGVARIDVTPIPIGPTATTAASRGKTPTAIPTLDAAGRPVSPPGHD